MKFVFTVEASRQVALNSTAAGRRGCVGGPNPRMLAIEAIGEPGGAHNPWPLGKLLRKQDVVMAVALHKLGTIRQEVAFRFQAS